jgi:hypothetical protein
MMLCVPAHADLALGFGSTFSGTSPSGTAPWLTATFHSLATNNVQLTLASDLQSSTEFISSVFINLDPALGNPAPSLVIAENSGVGFSVITFGTDCCKADGDGLYDLEIDFPTSAGSRFHQGSTAVFTFTLPGLTENSFDFLSTPAGGSGPFLAAAHIQGIGTDS